jgi:hypothetical protein
MYRLASYLLWTATGLALTGCSTSTDSKDGVSDTQGDTEDTEVGTVTVTGCITGQLRDFNNAAFPNASIRAVELMHCEELDVSNSFGDGTFCLENLPVQVQAELQTVFSERCTWEHSKLVQVLAKGNCDQPESCFNIETWFECEGDPLSCQ